MSDVLTPTHRHELEIESAILPEIIVEEGIYSLRLGDPLPVPGPGVPPPEQPQGPAIR